MCISLSLIVPSSGENAALFASLISRTAQDIDILIESLPSQAYTPEKQVCLNQSGLYTGKTGLS